MSPRNTAAGIAKLLRDTNSNQIVATETTLKTLVEEIRQDLSSSGIELVVTELPSLTTIFPKLAAERADDPFEPYLSTSRARLSDVAFYLHSSGTSGLPKTIPQTQLSILEWCCFRKSLQLVCMLPANHSMNRMHRRFSHTYSSLAHLYTAAPVFPHTGYLFPNLDSFDWTANRRYISPHLHVAWFPSAYTIAW